MSAVFDDYARRVMSGQERGPRAAALRAAMAVAELPYSLATALRNSRFDSGARKPRRLARPVISVGNITTGGTGKTPVVRWLAECLRADGMSVAILSRGYKAESGELGDEQRMLVELLNRGVQPSVIVRADPSRLRAGSDALREHPGVDVFLLDDGFQHRQLARDFDLVLIDATEPFGFGRLLPRGMLREPLAGALRRANGFLMTRTDHVDDATRARILDRLRSHNASAPVYESVHAPAGFREAGGADVMPVDALRGRKWFAFCGIGAPAAFVRQLQTLGGTCAGHRGFADHHDYTRNDVADVSREAAAAGAHVMVTTEKDWVKVRGVVRPDELTLPIWRLDVEIRFTSDSDESDLLDHVRRAMTSAAGR